jgi:hypothetical protein
MSINLDSYENVTVDKLTKEYYVEMNHHLGRLQTLFEDKYGCMLFIFGDGIATMVSTRDSRTTEKAMESFLKRGEK